MEISVDEFVARVRQSGLLPETELDAFLQQVSESGPPQSAEALAKAFVRQKKLTAFQGQMIYHGKGEAWGRSTWPSTAA